MIQISLVDYRLICNQNNRLPVDLVPNRRNQTLCLVPSPAIKKRGESAGWLSEQGKDGITMSLSLPEHNDCTVYMHSYAEYLLSYLIEQLIWTVVLLCEIIFVDI